MDQHRRARYAVKSGKPSHVIDVRVRADDCAHLEPVAANDRHDALDLVAGIDNDRITGSPVTENRAIALQQANGNYFVNEIFGHRNRV